MSPEEVAKALRWHANDPAGEEAAVKLRGHIAALEKERDEWFKRAMVAETMRDLHREERDASLADNAELTKRMNDALGLVADLPFHGHEGDEESGQHEPDCEQCTKKAISDCLTEALTQPHSGAALLEEHRKALVRVRNEGLEKAAKRLDEAAQRMQGFTARSPSKVVGHMATEIRAMKEPE